MSPVICITAAAECHPGKPRQLHLSNAYAAAISAAGGIPIIAAESAPPKLAQLCDALLLSGGGDVSPALYGQPVCTSTLHTDPERDAFEFSLAHAFLERRKPILGICRGCQVLNCLLGGTLYQDLPEQLGLIHLDDTLRHPIFCREGSVLSGLFGPRFRVNSTHHQAIQTLAAPLKCTAFSTDGVIEAFEGANPRQLLWGVQFHPERLTGELRDPRTPDFAPLFRTFVDASRHLT